MRNARLAAVLGAGRDDPAPRRRVAGQRSADSTCPLAPIVRYSSSMTLIWSTPNVAAGTRWAYEIATISANTEVARVHSPIVNSARTIIETAWAPQIPPSGTHHQNE